MLLNLIVLSLAISAILFLLDVFLTGKTPLITTSRESRKKISQILRLNDKSVFYDLGCGTGKLLLEFSRTFPSAQFIGIDNSPFSYVLAKIRVWFSGSKNIVIKFGNFFHSDLAPATHLYLWIHSQDMDRLLTKFEYELKPGTLLYSLDFRFSKKQPKEIVDLGKQKIFGHTLCIYKF